VLSSGLWDKALRIRAEALLFFAMLLKRPSELIGLERDYPCPCRCEGRLAPIPLTEALGCFKCQRIFVVGQEGLVISDVVASQAAGQQWRWTGREWYRANGPGAFGLVATVLLLVGVMLGMGVLYLQRPHPSGVLFLRLLLGAAIMMLLPAIMTVLSLRRWR
jgi:hypothetical protein